MTFLVYISCLMFVSLSEYGSSVTLIICTDCPIQPPSLISPEIFIVSKKFQNNSANVPLQIVYPIADMHRPKYRFVPKGACLNLPLSIINSNYIINREYPVKKANPTLDDRVDFFLYEIEKYMGNLVKNKRYLGNYINPNVMKICNEYMLISCNTWAIYQRDKDKDWQTGRLIKEGNRKINFQYFELGVEQCDTKVNHSKIGLSECGNDLNEVIRGQDPRFYIVNETDAFVLYSDQISFVGRYHQKLAWLKYDCSGVKKLTITNVWNQINSPIDNKGMQKNWVPFMWNRTVHMVQYLNPLTVLQLTSQVSGHDHLLPAWETSVVNVCDQRLSDYWNYGEIRGGTPAYLHNGSYLTFFHSVSCASIFKTYVYGALTFSRDPPFRVEKITPFPIADYWSYQGEWNRFMQTRRIDYVLFPMNFQIFDDQINLSLGRQDDEGWIYEISYKELSETMVPVEQKCNKRRLRL
jgi:predicted GH43/DUF377 family glycosyl hydrolase